MVRHWPADHIGSFSWFGLSIKEASEPIRPAAYQAGTLVLLRIKGTCGSGDPAPVRNKET
jgi:hypothetical protein